MKKYLICISIILFVNINTFSFEYSEENFTFNSDITLSAESYIHSNSDYLNWQYDFFDRDPMVNIALDFTFYDIIQAVAEFPIMKDRLVAENDTENYTNIITDISDLDMNFPNVAYITIGNQNLSLSMGRDLLTLGQGLILSPNTFYHDYLQGLTSWKYFNYGFTFLSLNEIEVESDSDDEDREQTTKYLIAHELGVTLFNKLSISIIESIMLQDLNFEISYLNPFIILHDEFLSLSEYANAFTTLNIEYTPIQGLEIFGELGIDQYATTYEEDNYDQVEPNAIGWIIGLEGIIPIGQYKLNILSSFTHTDPFLGLDSSGVNFTTTTNYVTHSQGDLDDSNGIAITDYLGVGPDREIFEINTDLLGLEKWSLGLDYTLLLLGDNSESPEEGDESAFDLTTPSGDVEIYNIVTLRSGYKFNSSTDLSGQISYVNQDSTIDFQFILSLSFVL